MSWHFGHGYQYNTTELKSDNYYEKNKHKNFGNKDHQENQFINLI